MADASAAASTGQQDSGGNLTVNGPNYVVWVVVVAVVLIGAYVYLKRKGKN